MARVKTWSARATRRVKWTTGVVPGLLDREPGEFPSLFGDLRLSRRRFVVIDEQVWDFYGTRIVGLLGRYGIEHNEPLILPGGEGAKTRESVDRILSEMQRFGVPRFGNTVVGWGGGVLHDTLGVAASEWRRGVEFTFFATTLVAAIDTMFALKCAISGLWKNRSGSYHPASRSWTDPQFFATLSDEDIREGMAEIIKWAVGGDARLFRLIAEHGARVIGEKFQGEDAATAAILNRTIRGMLRELAGNPYEASPRRRSYIGHGISPGFEPAARHGEAVTLDILLTALIAQRRGLISERQTHGIVHVIRSTGLPVWHPVLDDTDRMMEALKDTAQHRGGKQLIPAPVGRWGSLVTLPIGTRVAYLELSRAEIERARDDLRDLAAVA